MLKAENLFLTLGVALLAAALAMAAWSWSETASTRGWHRVGGRVIEHREAFKQSQTRYGQSLTWVPVVRYSYEVGGTRLIGERVYPGTPREWAERGEIAAFLAEHYPPGAAVTVYYNPANPRLAALRIESDYSWTWVLGGTGLLFLVIGAVLRPLIRRAPR